MLLCVIILPQDLKPIKIRLSKGGTSGKQLEAMVKNMEKDVWEVETERAQETLEAQHLRNGGPTTQIGTQQYRSDFCWDNLYAK